MTESRIIHISDTHFGTERPEVKTALLRLCKTISPQLAIISGDITQRAKQSEFTEAKRFFDALPIPEQLIIPGNHDIPLFNIFARIFSPYRNQRNAFGHTIEPIYRSERLLVICVNTTRNYRHEDGEISRHQIRHTCDLLASATADQLKIVVTHQPVYVTEEKDKDNLLHGYQAAIKAWADSGADMILGGHIHLPFVVPLHEKLAGIDHPIWAVQAGTAISNRIRRNAGNSVNVIRYSTRSEPCLIERWDYIDASQDFSIVTTHTLQVASS